MISNSNNFTSKEILDLAKFYNVGNMYISVSPSKAEELYMLSLKRGDKTAYIYLGNMYYDGIKNYLEPDVTKALYFYNKAIQNGYNDCLLDLGDIYMYGFRELEPDRDMAYNCYKKLLKKGSYEYKLAAYDRLLQLNDEQNTKDQNIYKNADYFYNENPEKKWEFVNNIEGSNYVKGTKIIEPNDFSKFVDLKNKKTTKWDNLNLEIIDVNKDAQPVQDIIPDIEYPVQDFSTRNINTNIIRNDRQNVHDHVVSKTVKKSASNLKEKTKITKDLPTTLKEIRDFLSDINDDEKKKMQ